MAAVPPILFLLRLFPLQNDALCIDDDHMIAVYLMGRPLYFVLATQHVCKHKVEWSPQVESRCIWCRSNSDVLFERGHVVAESRRVRFVKKLELLDSPLRGSLEENYLLHHCGARRALFNPGFFRSRIRASRRRYPAFLSTVRRAGSNMRSARLMPWRIASD